MALVATWAALPITERHHGELNLVKTKSAYTAVSQARPEETNYLLNLQIN